MPTLLPAIAATAGLVGGGISAFGQMKQGQEIREAQEHNAEIASQEAGLIRQNAVLNELRQRKALEQQKGSMLASYAKSGIELSGSPLDVIADSLANAELEIQTENFNAESAARNRESQAEMDRWYGREAEKSGYYRAVGTLLSSGIDSTMKLSKEKGKTKLGEGEK